MSLRSELKASLAGKVLAAHTGSEHFYQLEDGTKVASVTTKMIVAKPALHEYYARQAVDYFLKDNRYRILNDSNLHIHKQAAIDYSSQHKEEAAALGTFVHGIIERHLTSQSNKPMVDWLADDFIPDYYGKRELRQRDARIVCSLLAAEKAMKESGFECLYSEVNVGSKSLGTAGQVDAVMYDPQADELEIWDWKTTNSIHDTYAMQLAAYKYMFEEMTGKQVARARVVHIRKDKPKYNFYTLADYEASLEAFKNIAAVYDWQESDAIKLTDESRRSETIVL